MEKSYRNQVMEHRLIQPMKAYLTFILLALLLAACSTETERRLSHADSVMEENPGSAMHILKGIDRRTLKDSDLPYYALLYTQAQVKTDVPLDSDSLISIAYAKYGNKTSGDLGIRSNFYSGEIFFNQQNYREAMPYYLPAYEESKRLGNDYWHAKAAERMADLFFFAYNYDEAEQYAQEAAGLFKKEGRISNNRYTLGFMAIIQLNNGKSERAYAILDSLQTLVKMEMPVDSAFLTYINLPLLGAGIQTGEIDYDVSKQNLAYDEMSDRKKIDAAILESEFSNLHEQSLESLEQMMEVAHSDEDRIHLLYARYQNAKAAGKSALAFSLVDSMLFYQNAVAEDIIKESVTSAQRDFYSEMARRNEIKSKKFRWLLFGAVTASLFVIGVILVIHHFKRRAQDARLQANLESFLSLKEYSDRVCQENGILERSISDSIVHIRELDDRIQKSNIEVASLSAAIDSRNEAVERLEKLLADKNKVHTIVVERLFKEKWTTLDRLCDQYFGLNNSELTANALVANMEKELKKIVSKKGLADIVESVDTYMGGIVSRLRSQCPFLKEGDINLLSLLFAGFSVRAICMFIDIKYQNFYVKKSRLMKRIQSSDAPDKELFLEKLK